MDLTRKEASDLVDAVLDAVKDTLLGTDDVREQRKDVFILGVYASAVHARWVDASGSELVRALR